MGTKCLWNERGRDRQSGDWGRGQCQWLWRQNGKEALWAWEVTELEVFGFTAILVLAYQAVWDVSLLDDPASQPLKMMKGLQMM